jgi:hypothetical protein
LRALDRAFGRLDLAGQQLEQCGLARAVGADHADAVAARDAEGEILQDRALAIILGDVRGVDHHLGLAVVARGDELGGALRPEHLRAYRTHLDQLGEAALVAAAARGDAAQQPMLLELELGVEPRGVALLLGIDLLGPCLEPAEADFGTAQRSAIEPEGVLGQPGEEGTIVADDDEGTGEALQPVFEPFDRGEIEMVGRLVEQQHVGILRQRARDGGAAALAAARGGGLAGQIDAELVGDRLDLIAFGRVVAGERPVEQRRVAGQIGFLFEQDDLRAGHDRPTSFVRIDLAGDQPEQSGLARAVTADKSQAVAFAEMEVDVTKKPAGTLDEPQVFIGKDRCGHV